MFQILSILFCDLSASLGARLIVFLRISLGLLYYRDLISWRFWDSLSIQLLFFVFLELYLCWVSQHLLATSPNDLCLLLYLYGISHSWIDYSLHCNGIILIIDLSIYWYSFPHYCFSLGFVQKSYHYQHFRILLKKAKEWINDDQEILVTTLQICWSLIEGKYTNSFTNFLIPTYVAIDV